MSNILVLTAKEQEKLNEKLRSYGLRVGGGSIDYENERANIGIDYNGATYNEPAVAAVLRKELGVSTVVLNGLVFSIPA